MDMAKGKMGSLMGYIRHIVLSTVLGLSAMPVVITRQPPLLECGWAYCSTGEYCDDIMGCTGCDMICQPDVMYPECQKQCPGFTLPPVTSSPDTRLGDGVQGAALEISQNGRQQLPPDQSPGDPAALPNQGHDEPTGHTLPIVVFSLAGVVVVVVVIIGFLMYKHVYRRTSTQGRARTQGRAPTRHTTQHHDHAENIFEMQPLRGSVEQNNDTMFTARTMSTALTTHDVTVANVTDMDARNDFTSAMIHNTDDAASQTGEKTITGDSEDNRSANGHKVVHPTDDPSIVFTECDCR